MSRPGAIPIDRSPAWARRQRGGAGDPALVAAAGRAVHHHLALNAEDGTVQLLRSGFAVAGVAALALVLALFVFGGIGPAGPRSVAGWLCLMVAMMSMPFGLLLLLLGGAKWLRNRSISRRGLPAST